MKLLTETEVAERLDVTKACLRRWRREGRGLPYVQVGRLVRYEPRAIERFIADHTQGVAGDGSSKELHQREFAS